MELKSSYVFRNDNSRQALAPILDLTPDGVKYHLNKLQKDGYLERKEGRKTGRWKVLIKK